MFFFKMMLMWSYENVNKQTRHQYTKQPKNANFIEIMTENTNRIFYKCISCLN